MRPVAFAWLVASLGLWAPRALASESRREVDVASAALGAAPARRDEARAALRAAVSAADEPGAVAEAHLLLGHMSEQDGAYAEALAEDRACMSAAPGTRWAVRASDRIDWLQARAEGNFGPLARLERVRHDPALAEDPAAIEALARDAETFPPGMVRVEAHMLVAEAWLGRMHRPGDAIGQLREVVSDPRVDTMTGRLAERELVDALVARGRVDEAVTEATAQSARLEPAFVTKVRRLVVRRRLLRGALALLAAFGGLVLAALARAWRRRELGAAGRALRGVSTTAVVFGAFVAFGGGLLASQYETGNAAPFLLFGAASVPVVLLARAWSAVGSGRRAARLARAALSGGAVLAMALVLLESLDPQYLEGFGL